MSDDRSRCPAPLMCVRRLRGHGVHSPFAYSLVREVFMKRRTADKESELYKRLRGSGIAKKQAQVITLMAGHCDYGDVAINESGGDLAVFTKECSIACIIDKKSDDCDVCIVAPRKGKEREKFCEWLVSRHDGMSIEAKGLLLIFKDKGLNQQHIKL